MVTVPVRFSVRRRFPVALTSSRTVPAARTGLDPAARATCAPGPEIAARALRAVYDVDPVYMRDGGSIPVAATFDQALGLPVVLLGFTQPASNAHAPNEWLPVDNFERGTRVIVRLFDELAAALAEPGAG